MTIRLAALLLFLWVGAGCGDHSSEKVISGLPEAGALYSLFDGEGGYRFGKAVVVEDDIVFVHLFENRWLRRPSAADAQKATKPLPVAYHPKTIAEMKPVKLEQSTVTPAEKETYETWKKGEQEIF